MVERYIPTRNIDRGADHAARLPELPIARSDDFGDASEDLQELDLTNHPSYQDRGNNRRRRRFREAPAAKTAPRSVSPAALPAIAEAVPEENGQPRNGNQAETGDRTRPTRGQAARSKPQEPAEVISVVMTADEQEVYAMLGISPLILFNGEVKNPRSAIVAVALPGQSPVLPPTSSRSTTREVEARESEDKAEDLPPVAAVDLPVAAVNLAEAAKPIAAEVIDLPDLAAIEPVEPEEANEPINRRRRRRSSATGAEQLSLET
jgi:ribonuclease E